MKRIVDPDAAKRVLLNERICAACGGYAGNAHHVLPRGRGGDDVYANLVPLCGSGTMGCHGAWHGNSYTVDVGEDRIFAGGPVPTLHYVRPLVERRDRDWVAERIGRYITTRRPDVLAYVTDKLGEFGAEWLRRNYNVETL